MTHAAKTLVLTAGEPAGIGPDLCVSLADSKWSDRIVVVADAELLRARAALLGANLRLQIYDANDSEEPAAGILVENNLFAVRIFDCGVILI